MTFTTFIYALCDPDTGRVRYVGKADYPKRRFSGHLSESKKDSSEKALWIRDLISCGLSPGLEILDEVPKIEWEFWEREYIKVFRMLGFSLLNAQEGGGGLIVHSEVTKQKIRQSLKGRPKPAWYSSMISERQRGYKNHRFGKPATKGFSGRVHSQEVKNKIGAKASMQIQMYGHPQSGGPGTFLGRKHSSESKTKMRYGRMLKAKNLSGMLPKNCNISIGGSSVRT